jgi:hypothetical protein
VRLRCGLLACSGSVRPDRGHAGNRPAILTDLHEAPESAGCRGLRGDGCRARDAGTRPGCRCTGRAVPADRRRRMTVTVGALRAGLATNLATITGLRASAIQPDNPTPPQAIIFPTSISFDKAFKRGLDEYPSRLRLSAAGRMPAMGRRSWTATAPRPGPGRSRQRSSRIGHSAGSPDAPRHRAVGLRIDLDWGYDLSHCGFLSHRLRIEGEHGKWQSSSQRITKSRSTALTFRSRSRKSILRSHRMTSRRRRSVKLFGHASAD